MVVRSHQVTPGKEFLNPNLQLVVMYKNHLRLTQVEIRGGDSIEPNLMLDARIKVTLVDWRVEYVWFREIYRQIRLDNFRSPLIC